MSLAVLGHAGMRTTLDGTLLIKPAYPAERRFYESLLTDPHIAPMRPYIPRFLGTLPPPALLPNTPPGRTELLLLENLCSAFAKPNTLDVKLGTVFHDAATHPEKVRRMQKTARETTSLGTGVRLAEFKVHDNETAQPVCTSKAYGKSIGEEELHEGIARFFPAHDESSFSSPSPSSFSTSSSSSSLTSSSTLGLPRRLLIPVLRGIRTAIARIRETYALVEMRVVGGSLFIVYEADWARVEQGLGLIDLDHNHNRNRNHEHDHNHNQNHEHEHNHNHNHIYEHEHEHEHDNEHDEHALYRVRIVDFAHTTVARGLGPDQGVLLGLDTMLRLLDARLMELELGC